MERLVVNQTELEYQVAGSGEPVLFIPPSLVAGAFRPLLTQPALADRHRLIRYHRRGMAGSTITDAPVTIPDQSADAAALLAQLGVERAHVVGHSYGGLIGLQLALDAPALVGSLALLEPNLTGVPNIAAFNEEIRPAFAAYRKGDKETAVGHFLNVVAGMPWERCKALIERNVSGGAAQAVRDADTFFAMEIPALGQWMFTAEHAARITCPVLSALGGLSHAFFREGRDLLRQWFPQLDELDVAGAGHLLQFQNPDALGSGLASFFARYPLAEQHRMAPTIQRTGPPGTAG